MPERDIICIGCPMGCSLNVTVENGEVRSVRGNLCNRGVRYAHDEVTAPRRMVTSLIRVGDQGPPLSVRTDKPIDKALIFPCLDAIRQARVNLPIRRGDVVIERVLGTDVNIIATRDLG